MFSRITIRTKIVALIVSTLLISLSSYLFIGTSLFIDDKTSYIYDYATDQLKTASFQFEREITKMQDLAKMTLLAKTYENEVLSRNTRGINVLGILYFKEDLLSRLEMIGKYGKGAEELALFFPSLNWDGKKFKNDAIMIQTVLNGEIGVAGTVQDGAGKDVPYFMAFTLAPKFLDSEIGSDIEMRIYDSNNKKLFDKKSKSIKFDEEAFSKTADDFFKDTFSVGAKDWITPSNDEFIVAHKSELGGQVHVFTIISKNVAFAAAETLVKRSLFLGLSIILVSLGISLAFSGSLTDRLRRLFEATKKVSGGDFTINPQLDKLKENSGDEIDGLTFSFIAMSKKIVDLLTKTAQNARMEKELEEAQTVQSLFFPIEEFRHQNISLYGKCIPATECGGDWWQYEKIGDEVIYVIGDVTGHGFSAALLTASVHAAFTLFLKTAKFDSAPEFLNNLVRSLSHVVAKAGAGKSTMSFLAVSMNLSTGESFLVNAAHRPAYLHRKDPNSKRSVKPLVGGQCPALGDLNDQHPLEPMKFQVNPGDILLVYTDGIIECKNPAGEELSKQNFIKMFEQSVEKKLIGSKTLCESIVKESLDFLGENANHLDDDITLVVASIPRAAKFFKKAA